MILGIRSRRLIGVFLAATFSLSVSVGAAFAADRKDELFKRIRTVYEVVEVWHKDGADLDKFTDGAIKGGLEALGDPHTNYFSPADYAGFLDSLNGNFSGIGAYLDLDGNYIVVTSPIKGTPAHQAGLMSGDRILEADGVSLVGATIERAVQLIRGPSGTSVKLKIERPSQRTTFTLTITRAQINIPEVDSKLLEGNLGYIQIASFGDQAVGDFFKAVTSLKSQGAKGLVIDLRQNGGGYLDAAVNIGSAFVPAGKPILWEVGKSGKKQITSSGQLINLPVVVLVDGGTASASEILAGAIQDYGVGPLVGTKTFGKGTVQQILTLTEGGGMKVTIAEYLTPNENHVHKISLTPDVVVEKSALSDTLIAPLGLERALLPNDVGLDVLDLQKKLEFLGYGPDTRGYFGLNTSDAVMRFAMEHGLPEEAAVTTKVAEALNAAVAAKVKELNKRDNQLEKAVELLKAKVAQ